MSRIWVAQNSMLKIMKDEEIKSYLEELRDFLRNPTYEVLKDKYFGSLGNSFGEGLENLAHYTETEESVKNRAKSQWEAISTGRVMQPKYEVVITPMGKIVLGRLESNLNGIADEIKKHYLELASKNIINIL